MIKDKDIRRQKYKVPYQQCKLHSQKLNYICLNSECHQQSLICSICRDQQKHQDHLIRPLKFYLQELEKKYSKSSKEDGLYQMLENLQIDHYQFYQKLKKTVQDIAEQFRKLQEEVTQKFSQIKTQIQEEIAKRNRFSEFYGSLKLGNVDQSNFLIQNYLPQATVGKISNLQQLTKLSQEICQRIGEVKTLIISRQSTDLFEGQKKLKNKNSLNSLDLKSVLKFPDNIDFDGSLLTQKKPQGGNRSVCLIDYPVGKLSGKLILKITQLKKNAYIVVGAFPKKVYQSMNEMWTPSKFNAKSCGLGSYGYRQGWKKNTITQFGQGSTLELSCSAGQFKVCQKSKTNTFDLPKDEDVFVFIVLIGEAQVRINHQK